MSNITLPTPPSTTDISSQILATMAALSGVLTDYNIGSLIRTESEAIGSVIEQQGVMANAEAFQAILYSALAAFDITPNAAVAASGTVTFITSLLSFPPAASQNIPIPQGTLVGTSGGIQFSTTASVLLPAGSSSVNVAVTAATAGSAGNVPASGINQILNNLSYPLYVYNAAATSGGVDAESSSQTLARFAAVRASIGCSTPSAIANAAIGVTASGTGETVLYSTLYEPWIAAGSGVGSGVAGWDLYIDNGSGAASNALIAAVNHYLNTAQVSGATNANIGTGFRDAGVPYNIYAVTPTLAYVSISGVVSPLGNVSTVSGAMAAAISGYFSLPFGTPAEQPQISATAANSALGALTSLAVSLSASGAFTSIPLLSCAVTSRIILAGLSINLTAGN